MPRRLDPPATLGRTGEQVRQRLLDQVAAGTLAPGQRLGGERELAVELGVSRSSLRQALAALEREGVVRRVPGRSGGTFVASDKVDRDLSRIVGVPALLADQGFSAGTRVLSTRVTAADRSISSALGLSQDTLVVEIVRLRLADGDPISLERARFSAERFPGLLEQPLGGSLYELLAQHYDTEPVEADERIEVVAATPDEAALLGVAAGSPLLSVTRTSRDARGPVEHSHDLFRADRTRITVRTVGRSRARSADGRIVELRSRAR